MMALMHEGTPYGHLTVGSEALTDTKLAKMVGESVGKVKKILSELEAHGVFSRVDGVIFSRRMVRDEHIRNVRAQSGKKGGNPELVDPPSDNHLVDDLVNQKQTPSTSSSPSTASSASELTDTNYHAARDGLRERLPEEYRGDLDGFLRSVGSTDRQYSWVRSLEAALKGNVPELSEAVPPDAVGYALRQYSGNGDRPVWIRFLGYLRNANAPQSESKPSQKANDFRAQSDSKGEALLLIGELRSKRKHIAAPQGSGSYQIDRAALELLSEPAKRAVQAIGGLGKIANHPEESFSILASQFAAMYSAANQKESTA